jgi:hypothetical protein
VDQSLHAKEFYDSLKSADLHCAPDTSLPALDSSNKLTNNCIDLAPSNSHRKETPLNYFGKKEKKKKEYFLIDLRSVQQNLPPILFFAIFICSVQQIYSIYFCFAIFCGILKFGIQ